MINTSFNGKKHLYLEVFRRITRIPYIYLAYPWLFPMDEARFWLDLFHIYDVNHKIPLPELRSEWHPGDGCYDSVYQIKVHDPLVFETVAGSHGQKKDKKMNHAMVNNFWSQEFDIKPKRIGAPGVFPPQLTILPSASGAIQGHDHQIFRGQPLFCGFGFLPGDDNQGTIIKGT